MSAIWSIGISSRPKLPCVSTGTPFTSTLIFLPSMPRMLILPSLPMPPDLRTLTPEAELTAFETVLLVFCISAASIVATDSAFLACFACSASISDSTESSSNCVTPEAFAADASDCAVALFASSVAALLSGADSSRKSSIEVISSSWARAETAPTIANIRTSVAAL